MPRDAARPETVLITGASAGIGTEIARAFAAHGHPLVLVARRKGRLTELATELRREHGGPADVVAIDLAVDGAAKALHDEVEARGLAIDVLVNNAGVLYGGAFRRTRPADLEQMLRLNVLALTLLCRLFAPAMIRRGGGSIVNVASLGAFQPVPSLAAYAATKAYVLSLGEALAVELGPKGVSVTTLCPGFTDTDMLRDAAGRSSVPRALVMAPGEVARSAYRAWEARDVIAVPGLANSLIAGGSRLTPRWLLRRLSSLAVRRR